MPGKAVDIRYLRMESEERDAVGDEGMESERRRWSRREKSVFSETISRLERSETLCIRGNMIEGDSYGSDVRPLYCRGFAKDFSPNEWSFIGKS